MKYKGYEAIISFDDDARIFYGEVVGIKDVITFQGSSVNELEEAFHDSVDDYLDFCKARGENPEKEFSGNLRLRIPPKLHAILSQEAHRRGISLNKLIYSKLQN
jgi:predicted HicB family RNase H-like nuclease